MGLLYILKAATADQIKIGVTDSANTLRGRLTALGGLALFDLAASSFFECERPRVVEQFLHLRFSAHRVSPSDAFVQGAGRTECFSAGAHAEVLQFVADNDLGAAKAWAQLTGNSATPPIPKPSKPKPGPLHDAHITEHRRAEARRHNANVLRDVRSLIGEWAAGGHIVGRYRTEPDGQNWVLTLKTNGRDPLHALRSCGHHQGDWPAYWLRPVADPYQPTFNGYGWALFTSYFSHGGTEYGTGVALPPWLTAPDEAGFLDSFVLDESLQDLHMLLLELPMLDEETSAAARKLHSAGYSAFLRQLGFPDELTA